MLATLIEREKIDCGFEKRGMFVGAYSQDHYQKLAEEAEELERFGYQTEMVGQAAQHSELGSDYYHGGRIMADGASLHPALYHDGLLRAARGAGVRVIGSSPVAEIHRDGGAFIVKSGRGDLRATEILVSTDAYSSGATAWARAHMLRLRSYVVATEPLGQETLSQLFPTGRTVYDTRRISFYFRPSPDGIRLVFGSRPRPWEVSEATAAKLIREQIIRVFPSLTKVAISHCWSGYVGYTGDKLPRAGRRKDGIHYCFGYCGQGVSTATWLATEFARSILAQNAELGVFGQGMPPELPPLMRSGASATLAIGTYQLLDSLGL